MLTDNSKAIAVIITGRLDYTDTSRVALQGLHRIADVFVATDKHFMASASELKPVSVSLADQDQDGAFIIKLLKTLPEGEKLIQWVRLKSAWKAIEAREKSKGKKYSVVFKLRTDLVYTNVNWFNESFQDGELYCVSDICFGGKRETFKEAAFFVDHFFDYYQRDRDYFQLNPEQILRCDLSAAKFHWLRYPKIAGFKITERNLRQYLETLTKSSELNFVSPKKTVTSKKFLSKFSSEKWFLQHLLDRGLVIRAVTSFSCELDQWRQSNANRQRAMVRALLVHITRCQFRPAKEVSQSLVNMRSDSLKVNIVAFFSEILFFRLSNIFILGWLLCDLVLHKVKNRLLVK